MRSPRDKPGSAKATTSQLKRELAIQAAILFGFLALIWTIELCDRVFLHGALDTYGIRPRTLTGLRGVLLAPLLHGGFGHARLSG